MRGFDEFEPKARRVDKAPGKYMVCVGGYPREAAATLAEAEARARDLAGFEPEGDVSIYEVETGIHFDVAQQSPGPEEGVMPGVFNSYFARVQQMS